MSKSTTTTTAVPMGGAPEKPVKQGHSFLFCLCDMRRAVIMMDTLSLLASIIGIILIVLAKYYGNEEDVKIYLDNYDFWALIAIQAVGLFCRLFGILGAVNFSICPILLVIIWQVVYAVLCGLDRNWIGLAVYVFWLYPHVVLCRELAKGIMTRENYRQQERQSCCCV